MYVPLANPEGSSTFAAPLSHTKPYGPKPPPETVRSIEPLEAIHDSTIEVLSIKIAVAGSATTSELSPVQRLASVTVTVYIPATKPVIFCVVEPSDHAYVYGPFPPDGTEDISPATPSKQILSTGVRATNTVVGSVIANEVISAVHRLASVTVTV